MLTRRMAALLGTVAAAGALAGTVPSAALAADDPDVVLTEDFGGGAMPAGFRAIEGDWTVADGRLVGRSAGGQISRLTFGPHLNDYRFEATVRFNTVENDARWLSLILDGGADGSPPWWQAALRTQSTATNGTEVA